MPRRNMHYSRRFGHTRPLLRRLTVVAWLTIGLFGAGGATGLAILLGFAEFVWPNNIDLFEIVPVAYAAPIQQVKTSIEPSPALTLHRLPDGSLRGDPLFEAAIVNDVTSALDWSSQQTPERYLSGYASHATQSFTGEWLAAERKAGIELTVFTLKVAGEYRVHISHFAEDGGEVTIHIARRGLRIDGYDRVSGARVLTNISVPDSDELVRVSRDPIEKRWKISQTLGRRII